jgi:DNA-directed RNA polymerase specialized sigma54-like protein
MAEPNKARQEWHLRRGSCDFRMTPQLRQAIRLLQLTRLELIEEIRKELEANQALAGDTLPK